EEQLLDFLGDQVHLFASQEVLDFDRAQLGDFGLAGGELIDGGNGAEFNLQLLQSFGDLSDPFGGSAGHGDDDFFQFEIHSVVEQNLRRANHWNILHPLSPFHAVIVKEGDRLQAKVAPSGELLGQSCPD